MITVDSSDPPPTMNNDDVDPVFSPDGSRIAFERSGGTNVDIYVMNADGTGQTPLTTAAGFDGTPDWQPIPNADLSLAKAASAAGASAGDQVTFTLTVQNAGPNTAQGVTVSDPVPAGATLVSASTSQGSCGAPEVTCALGALARGASATVTITVQANQVGTLANSASVSGTLTDPNPANNAAEAGVAVTLRSGRCTNEQRGSALADTLTGTPAGDRLIGLGGNDVLSGASGEDCLDGGPGRDRLSGGGGGDSLLGRAGRDVLSGGTASDSLLGGADSDTLSGAAGSDSLSGGAGNDKINGGQGGNRVSGGTGDDNIVAANGRREPIDCGPGRRDKVRADATDRLRGCERVSRPRRSGR